MISIQGLTKTYHARAVLRSAVHVLRGVDLEVGRGEVFGIVGHNGAGKTTLLEILATIVLPDSGRAAVAGHDVVAEAGEVRRLVAYCPGAAQTFYPRLTGLQNLEFFAALHGVVGTPAQDRIREALDIVGIDGAAQGAVQSYSDGMRQRLALARALVPGARVLLLDEPTKSLDPPTRTTMHRLFRSTLIDRLRMTIVLVTHSLDEAVAVCDRVARLERGRVTDVGAPDAVMQGLSWKGC